MHNVPLNILLLALLFSGCAKKQQGETLFTIVPSSHTGIVFSNNLTEDEKNNILTYEYFYNGGGVAIGDINNDGLQDLYFSANQQSNKLYLNKGDLTFEDITDKAKVSAKSGWKTGVAMVDINYDGLLDIYVCRSGDAHEFYRSNALYINNGDLTFTDQASKYGLNDKSYSTASAFFDFDRDGDLDLFLLNHSRLFLSNSYDIENRYQNTRTNYVGNKLYRNDGDTFTDVSDEMCIYGPVSNYGLGVAIGDINKDGWPDLYTSNDYTEKDKVYLNEKGNFFREVSDSLLTHMSLSSMGVSMADLNNDELLDIISLDMLPESNHRQKQFFWQHKYEFFQAMLDLYLHHQYMRNMVHVNNGNGTFREIGQFLEMSNTDWSWSPLIADYDNDGLQDIFITNGFKKNFTSNDFLTSQAGEVRKIKMRQSSEKLIGLLDMLPDNEEHDYMFRNMGNLQFANAVKEWGFEQKTLSNGPAYSDLDNDGDLDIVINCVDGEALIYQNNSEVFGNHYLKIVLEGADKNPFGIGSEVTIVSNGTRMFRALNPYVGFQSSVEPSIMFGLGKNNVVDSLLIRWPDGTTELKSNIQANQVLILRHQDASIKEDNSNKPKDAYFNISGRLPFKHRENDFVDFNSQPLLPRMYSTMGPAAAQGDIDNDGLIDVFLGGAKGQPGEILRQTDSGKYDKYITDIFESDKNSEDIDAIFFDMDNDQDQDLYVVSGGNEFEANDPLLQDRLYENISGSFVKKNLLKFHVSGSCVRPADVDRDGDLDLFVGGRIIPERYPEKPKSYLLVNDGKGNFIDGSDQYFERSTYLGMVSDAIWHDLDQDNYPDLIVVGEWMPILLFSNKDGVLIVNDSSLDQSTQGWWNSIVTEDIDEDGDQDFILGNFGMNQQYKATIDEPITLYYSDFDNNGTIDPIINYYIQGVSNPMPLLDELKAQIPTIKNHFTSYESYTDATIENILIQDEIKVAEILKATTFLSSILINEGDRYILKPLPNEAQYSPLFALGTIDINNDGLPDLVTGGNITAMPLRYGRISANFGDVFLNLGDGNFVFVKSIESGIGVKGDVRKILIDGDQVLFVRNNAAPLIYELTH